MNLYEINAAIANFQFETDEATGEVLNFDALDALHMERDTKRENIALLIKNEVAEVEAIKAEAKTLTERARVKENDIERWKKYLAADLAGEKFETAKCKVGFRRSEAVVVDDGFMDWALTNRLDLVRYKAPEPNKTAIKAALNAGEPIEGAALVEQTTMQIK